MSAPSTTGSVTVTVPADSAYLRHLRVLAATVADDAGFDVEAIESLRLAVDELCALAIGDADERATLTAVLDITETHLWLRGHCAPVLDDPVVDPIARQLLAAGASEFDLRRDGDRCVFELTAHRPGAGDGASSGGS